MTEAEWLACPDPQRMIRFVIGCDTPRVQDVEAFPDRKGSDRRLRLFACACYRRIRHLLPDPRALAAVMIAEGVADGLRPAGDLAWAEARLREPLDAMEMRWRAATGAEHDRLAPTHDALALAFQAVLREAPKAAYYASSNAYHATETLSFPGSDLHDPRRWQARQAEQRGQADLLRCLFGDLFHSADIPPSTGETERLARAIYNERDWDALPILADAVEEAGCADEALLSHLRSRGAHGRGCWALDLVLGKG